MFRQGTPREVDDLNLRSIGVLRCSFFDGDKDGSGGWFVGGSLVIKWLVRVELRVSSKSEEILKSGMVELLLLDVGVGVGSMIVLGSAELVSTEGKPAAIE